MWTSSPMRDISALLYTNRVKKASKDGVFKKIISCEKVCGQVVWKSGQGGKKKEKKKREKEKGKKKKRDIHKK